MSAYAYVTYGVAREDSTDPTADVQVTFRGWARADDGAALITEPHDTRESSIAALETLAGAQRWRLAWYDGVISIGRG